MNTPLIIADSILVMHFVFVLFVVLSVPVIIAGRFLKWDFVHNRYFRMGHLFAIGFVLVNTWLGETCPLTIWENNLREAGGEMGYGDKTFISYWIGELMYFDLPLSFFAIVYTAFTALIVSLFWIAPIRFKKDDIKAQEREL